MGFSLLARPGIKKDKLCILLAFLINNTRDDFFKIWVIGKVKVLYALKGYNFVGSCIVWRNNKKV